MTSQKDIWTRIAAYLAKEMNDTQKEDFLTELKSNDLLKKEFELMKNSWNHIFWK